MAATSPPVVLTSDDVAACFAALTEQGPLVQYLTNVVVAGWTANVLLAVGAAPAMVDNSREAAGFAAVAGGVLVNLGTPYPETVAAMEAAASSASAAVTPWVLDPVAAGALPWRTEVAQRLLAASPTIVRGNASEILALAGGAGGRGVDATHDAEDTVDVARSIARRHGTVVAVSGRVDVITDGDRVVRVENGHPWLTRVTGVGCALGALMAATAATGADPVGAAVTATAAVTVAAEGAVEHSRGPGSFAAALLDELAALTPDELAVEVRLS